MQGTQAKAMGEGFAIRRAMNGGKLAPSKWRSERVLVRVLKFNTCCYLERLKRSINRQGHKVAKEIHRDFAFLGVLGVLCGSIN
jgi:hypothetical protein